MLKIIVRRRLKSVRKFLMFLYEVVYNDIEQYDDALLLNIISECNSYEKLLQTLPSSIEKQENLSALSKAKSYLKSFLSK